MPPGGVESGEVADAAGEPICDVLSDVVRRGFHLVRSVSRIVEESVGQKRGAER